MQCVKLTFSLKGTFHPTKTENRTKTSLTQLSPTALSKYTILAKNTDFFQKKKNSDISQLRKPWY